MNDDSGVRALSSKVAEGAAVKTKQVKKTKKEPAKEVSVQKVPNRKPGGQGMFVTRQHVTFDEAESEEDVPVVIPPDTLPVRQNLHILVVVL